MCLKLLMDVELTVLDVNVFQSVRHLDVKKRFLILNLVVMYLKFVIMTSCVMAKCRCKHGCAMFTVCAESVCI